MSVKQRIESAISVNEDKIDTLEKERIRLNKIKHFDEKLKYAFNKVNTEIYGLASQNDAYQKVLNWMEEEDK